MAQTPYPKREKFFAQKVIRLMAKVCLANQIGPDACWLLTIIATCEDAARYRGPVSYYTEQLLPLLGFTKWDRLDRARKAAIDAGWLSYESGGHRKPGWYFVTIPHSLPDIEDGPISEEFDTPNRGSNSDLDTSYEGTSGGQEQSLIPARGEQVGEQAGVKGGNKRGSTGGTILPIPNPIPFPREGERESDQAPPDEFQEEPDLGQGPHPLPSPELVQEVLDTWNACPNVNKSKFLTEPRRRLLMTRLRVGIFRDHWREAIAKIAASEFFVGWKPGFDWFLDESNFVKILEGNYDHKSRAGPGNPGSAPNRNPAHAKSNHDKPAKQSIPLEEFAPGGKYGRPREGAEPDPVRASGGS